MKRLLIFFAVLWSGSVLAEIITTDRRITWQGFVGVPGGVTNRTLFTNVTDAPYSAYGDNSHDDTAAIQAAIDDCPEGKYVYIPAGHYRITELFLKSGMTLKGENRTNTILHGRGTTDTTMICFGADDGHWEHQGDSYTTISSGSSKGSTNIVVASASGMAVGSYLLIDQIDDGVTVTNLGNAGSCDCCGIRHGQNRHQSQIARIDNISGTTITINMPLFAGYTNSPEAVPFASQCEYAGLESLQLYATNSGYLLNFAMFNTAFCWVKDIESNYADGDHGWVGSSYRCEIRDSYFHDGYIHGPGSTDDTIQIFCGSSGVLVENNIMRRLHAGIILKEGGGGHVVAYNFVTNGFTSSSDTVMMPDWTIHGVHLQFCLFEGNVSGNFNADGVWGTSAYLTLLRNCISGQNYSCPPYTGRSAEQTNSMVKQYEYDRCINLAGFGNNKFYNVVGNVLGTSTMGNYPTYSPLFMKVAPTTYDSSLNGMCWTLGYADGSDTGDNPNDNSAPFDTLVDHGNWNVVSNVVTWATGISDHDIPDSYYLSSKPSFFGSLTWPPIDPENLNVTITNVPAVYRWFNGVNPPAESTSANRLNATIGTAIFK